MICDCFTTGQRAFLALGAMCGIISLAVICKVIIEVKIADFCKSDYKESK